MSRSNPDVMDGERQERRSRTIEETNGVDEENAHMDVRRSKQSKRNICKKTRQKKANLPHVKEFSQLIATCKEILHNPERRAAWQAKYDEAMRKARKHNKPIQGRLCDYVRHEVSMALRKGEILTI